MCFLKYLNYYHYSRVNRRFKIKKVQDLPYTRNRFQDEIPDSVPFYKSKMVVQNTVLQKKSVSN